jgi:DHA2 family multidrug resistance protein
MVALALGYPIGGWLVRRGVAVPAFLLGLLGFALLSGVCASAADFHVFLLARVLLGLVGGATLPMGQVLLLHEYPLRRKALGMSVWSVSTLIPFSVGPPCGGWIADMLGWRYLFWLNAPVALALTLLLGALLYGRYWRSVRMRFDVLGFGLCVGVMLGFQTLLNEANDRDWLQTERMRVLALGVAAMAVLWVVQAWQTRRPFVDLRLLARRNVAVAVTILVLGFMIFQGLLSLLIVQLQLSLGYSSWLAGLVFLPMAVFAKPAAALMQHVLKRVDARWLVCLSMLGFAHCYSWLSQFDDATSFAALLGPKLLEGACLGAFFVPLNALMLHGLPLHLHAQAVELASLLRIAAGGIGIALQNVVLYRRAPQHLHRLLDGGSDFDYVDRVAQTMRQTVGYSDLQTTAKVVKLIGREAVMVGIDDAFWLSSWICLGLAGLVWMARPTRQPAALAGEGSCTGDP